MDSEKFEDPQRAANNRFARLSSRVAWNLLGLGVPVLVALFTVPRLVAGMGTERFGVLTLAWVLIGYFSVFDLGLGRALTRSIATQLARGQAASLPGLVATATTIMMCLGGCVGVLLAFMGPIVVTRYLRVAPNLVGEVVRAVLILSATVPCVVLTTAHRGVLEAFGRFDWSNQIRLPLGVLNFVAPLVVLPYSASLDIIIGSLAMTRIASWGAYRFASRRLIPTARWALQLDRTWVRPLLAFSGWATVSTVIGPVMIYLDRFLIGAFISLSAVAYYATPYDILNRLGLIPSAVIDAIFPMMSSTLVSDRRAAAILHYDGMLAILFFMIPPVCFAVFYAHEGLSLWLGSSFAEQGGLVAQWIALGVLFNAIARVALNTLYADGRAFVVAKLHLVELVPYLSLLVILGWRFGLPGVAAAWTMRVLVDMCALQILADRILRRPALLLTNWALVSSAATLIVVGTVMTHPVARATIMVVLCCGTLGGLVRLFRHGRSSVFSAALRD